MQPRNRRVFMIHAVATGATLACGAAAAQGKAKKVEESEPKAASLGYRHDSAQVDKKRFPKHQPGEQCRNCMAWLGSKSDAWAECDLMVERLVSATGWCSSYVKAG